MRKEAAMLLLLVAISLTWSGGATRYLLVDLDESRTQLLRQLSPVVRGKCPIKGQACGIYEDPCQEYATCICKSEGTEESVCHNHDSRFSVCHSVCGYELFCMALCMSLPDFSARF